jgi:hypothetical protein
MSFKYADLEKFHLEDRKGDGGGNIKMDLIKIGVRMRSRRNGRAQ